VTLGLELMPVQKVMSFSIGEWWQNLKAFKQGAGSSSTEPLLKDSTGAISTDMEDDIDVQEERDRVISGLSDNTMLYLQNLRKVLKPALFTQALTEILLSFYPKILLFRSILVTNITAQK